MNLGSPPAELTEWLVLLLAFAGALAFAGKVWQRAIEPAVRHALKEILEPELNAIRDRLAGVEGTLTSELTINAGSSLKDAVTRIEHTGETIDAKVTDLAVRASNTETALAAHHAWSQRAVAAVDADRVERGLEPLPGARP